MFNDQLLLHDEIDTNIEGMDMLGMYFGTVFFERSDQGFIQSFHTALQQTGQHPAN